MTYYEHLFGSNKGRLLNQLNNLNNELKNKTNKNLETYDKYRNELAKDKLSNLGSLGNHIEGAFKGVYHLNPYEVLSNTSISAIDLVGVAADVVSATCGVVSYAASQEKGTAVNAAFQAFVYSTLLAGATFTVGAYVPMIAPAFNANNVLQAVNIITKVSGATFAAVGSVKAAYYIKDEAYSIAKNIADTANYAVTSVNNFAKDTVDTANYAATSVNNFAKDTVDTVNYAVTSVNEFAKSTSAPRAALEVMAYSALFGGITCTVGSYVPVIAPIFTNAHNISNAAGIIAKLGAATFGVVGSVQAVNYITDSSAAIAKSAFDTICNIADTASYVNTNLMNYVVEPVLSAPGALCVAAMTSMNAANTAMHDAITVLDANVVQPLMNNQEVYEPVGVFAAYGITYAGENYIQYYF